ncbi:MAG: MFS transporter [Pseudomonadota bacterium]
MKWKVLGALTLARTAMGLQFQSVAALGSGLQAQFELGDAALGALIGLYLLPGVVLAIPGGALARRFGDVRLVILGLAMMTAGAVLAFWGWHWSGRIIAGTGAVLVNVLGTKIVADWFDTRDLPVAMGIFIVSWPLGLALALVTLPIIGAAFGVQAGLLATGAAMAVALVIAAGGARSAAVASGAVAARIEPAEVFRASLAGLVWTFYNTGFILLLAYGPGFLVERGLGDVAAAALASVVGWLILPSLAAGGWIVAMVRAPKALTAACLIASSLLVVTLPATAPAVLPFVLIGLLIGPPGPLIMTLPAAAVRAEVRALGFGIYFTWYYIGMALAPALAGALISTTGSAVAPLHLAAGSFLAATACLWGFTRTLR